MIRAPSHSHVRAFKFASKWFVSVSWFPKPSTVARAQSQNNMYLGLTGFCDGDRPPGVYVLRWGRKLFPPIPYVRLKASASFSHFLGSCAQNKTDLVEAGPIVIFMCSLSMSCCLTDLSKFHSKWFRTRAQGTSSTNTESWQMLPPITILRQELSYTTKGITGCIVCD